MSRDTWAEARRKITVSKIIDRVQPWLEEADGITISGGEPFEQPEALFELLEGLQTAADTSVIAYSGFPLEQLMARHPSILELIDLLISEPFDSTKAVSAPLFGSTNQRATCLTKRGAEIWQMAEAAWRDRGGRLDLIAEADGSIWVAGVPGPGDLERLGTRLRSAGITPLTSAGRLGVST